MQPFIDADPIEPGTCPAADDQLVTVRPDEFSPADLEVLYARADRLIANGLTFDEYRLLQCSSPEIGESAEPLWAVVNRLESAQFLRLVCQCGARRTA